ncbi:ribosomal RNA small subunit methyltransferase A [Candidatus Sneabacter namystus]|uniref:Ribosomal RNA small subunit methyltransferase A n=2 Tax=Candidatus Sneabacter namystus TaxID=2601646 RepID=A0A5C0UJ54_9RICK|nr:ribosomal RNA small subunit methyltransferase A [Candidatus Sneabacter namystus]
MCDKIALSSPEVKNSCILEIGPGTGHLTKSIIKLGPSKLIAIEKDTRMKQYLTPLQSRCKVLEVIYEDILASKFLLSISEPTNIIANIPYNISSPILLFIVRNAKKIRSATITLQKEVAERVCASHNTKKYGRLSVLCQSIFHCSKLMDIPRQFFYPTPSVDSCTILLTQKEYPIPTSHLTALENITKSAFTQRRKMIKTSLSRVWNNTSCIFNALSINGNIRAENISVDLYVQLAKHWIECGCKELLYSDA